MHFHKPISLSAQSINHRMVHKIKWLTLQVNPSLHIMERVEGEAKTDVFTYCCCCCWHWCCVFLQRKAMDDFLPSAGPK